MRTTKVASDHEIFSRGRDRRPIHRAQGFTLIEVAVALAILAIIAVVFGEVVISSTTSMDYLVTDNTSDMEIKRSLNTILNELRLSSNAVITLDTSDANFDTITFQTPDAYGSSVDWGASDSTGAWNANWSVRYTVANGRLVRRVLNALNNQVGSDEILARGIDSANGAVKGFQVTQNGPVVNVLIRVRKTPFDGKAYEKQMSTSIFLKNA